MQKTTSVFHFMGVCLKQRLSMATPFKKCVACQSMSTKAKILITHSEVPPSALDILRDKYELIFSPGIPYPSREQLLKDVKGVDAVFWVSKTKLDRENKWEVLRPTWMCGFGLEGSTVGIVGLGGIGCTIAKRLKAFDIANILYSGRKEKEEGKALGATFVPLDTLLRQSDFVIISCALNDQTRHLIDKDKLSKMKPTSILVNISRGGVINQDDLVEALQNNVIWGAGLDVMTPEPLPHDHPLTKLPNCVICPHLGSATLQTREAMAKLAANNIYNALQVLSPHLGTQTCQVTETMARLAAANIYNALNGVPLLTPVW